MDEKKLLVRRWDRTVRDKHIFQLMHDLLKRQEWEEKID